MPLDTESILDRQGSSEVLEAIVEDHHPSFDELTTAARQVLERYETLAGDEGDVGRYALCGDIEHGSLALGYLEKAGVLRVAFEGEQGVDRQYRIDRAAFDAYLGNDQ